MDAPLRSPRFPAVAVRAAALWVLVGAALKLLWATPADLPEVVRTLPFEIGLVYRTVIAVELFLGLLALLLPSRGWAPLGALLVGFLGVLAAQIAAGTPSCGCLGRTVEVPPAVMLGIDAAWLALILVARPWRLARRGGWAVAALALVVAVALPVLLDRQATGGPTVRPPAGLRPYAELSVDSWVGRPLAETELARWTDLAGARDGLWFFWRTTCPVCAQCLERMAATERGAREVTLVLLGERPDPEAHEAVHVLPEGPFVHRIDLPDTVDWLLTPPAEMVVEGGRVVSARSAMGPEQCP